MAVLQAGSRQDYTQNPCLPLSIVSSSHKKMPRCSAGQVTGAAQVKARASKHPFLWSLVSSAISPGALCTGETWQSALRAPCSAHIDSRVPREKQGFTTAPLVHML